MPSLSVSVARSPLTWASVPLIDQARRSRPATRPLPVADSSPLVSASVTVKVSPPVVGDLREADPADRPGLADPDRRRSRRRDRQRPARRGDGDRDRSAGAALLPKLSLALSVIVSAAVAASVSVSVPESLFTWAQRAADRQARRARAADGTAGAGRRQHAVGVGQRHREGLAAAVLPLSDRLTPAIVRRLVLRHRRRRRRGDRPAAR